MSDAELDEIEVKARQQAVNLKRCPTCRTPHEYGAPGVDLGWPTNSTYRYMDRDVLCDCEWQDELRQRYLLADIPKGYWTLGEDDFYGDAKAWKVAVDYLDKWPEYRQEGLGLEFHSRTQGTGKTFLLTYLARKLIQRGEKVHYCPFRSIMGLHEKPYEERNIVQDRLLYSTVLALDEVGKAISGAQGEYFAMEFENLIRSRSDSDRVTLMTTNLDPDELDRYYPRTYSLLAAKQIRWAITGEDVRRNGDELEIARMLAHAKETRPIQ